MFDPSCGRRERVANRRDFLRRAGGGCGLLALASLLDDEARRARADEPRREEGPLAPRPGHFPGPAKSVIWLFMEGGPSAFDLFDPKPELQKRHGQRIAIETFFGSPGPLMKSPWEFAQHGESGAWVCDRLPHLAKCVDDLAWIKSCHTESSNHSPAMYQMNTGIARPGFPSAGAWITYGLGSENQDLPGFVVLGNKQGSKGGSLNWSAGFLPGAYQGTVVRSEGPPIANLARGKDVLAEDQRAQLDLARDLNDAHRADRAGESDLVARVETFELAFRMQTAAKEVVDVDRESEETKRLYGLDRPATKNFGRKCLMARRLVESGVRFVQVFSDGEWDAHGNLRDNHGKLCEQTDQPIAALLTDLKRRGLLDSTLVVWGGEFGRMPVTEGNDGRDHNPFGFLTWMAGAGIKGGVSHGATDEFGHRAVVDPVSVNDLHATMLHLLGVDHKKLTYLHNGRRFRLTDVAGNVLTSILKNG